MRSTGVRLAEGDIEAALSAVLRWLLGHPNAATVQSTLASASSVVTSALTTVEVARSAAAEHWKVHAVTDAVLDRAADGFPIEPVRGLDAIHLATVILCHREIPLGAILSTDERVRDNAKALGFALAPAPA